MYLELSTAPTADAVALSDLLDYLKLSSGDDDANAQAVLDAATAHFDGRDGILNRALTTQTWKLYMDSFPDGEDAFQIPLPPLQSVDSIEYVDVDGTTQTLSTSLYRVTGGYSQPARVQPAFDEDWPTTRDVNNAVTVTFTAGYNTVPNPIKMAIKLVASDLYEMRQETVIGHTVNETKTVSMLVAPFIVRGFY